MKGHHTNFSFEPEGKRYLFEFVPNGWIIDGLCYPKDTGIIFSNLKCSEKTKKRIRDSFAKFWNDFNAGEEETVIAQRVIDIENELKRKQ